jgi:hypothetical protein
MTGFQFLGRFFEKLERMQTLFCVASLGAIVVVLSLEILLRQFLALTFNGLWIFLPSSWFGYVSSGPVWSIEEKGTSVLRCW